MVSSTQTLKPDDSDIDGDGDNSSDYNTHGDSDSALHEDGDESNEERVVEHSLPDKLPRNMYRYKNKHPLFDTHVTIVNRLKPNTAVNFIGCTVPRCDQGDREFYCLTMLAFSSLGDQT